MSFKNLYLKQTNKHYIHAHGLKFKSYKGVYYKIFLLPHFSLSGIIVIRFLGVLSCDGSVHIFAPFYYQIVSLFLVDLWELFPEGKFKLYHNCILTDLLSVVLGKHTHYFPAYLLYCHAENKAKESNRSAHSMDHCVRGTSSLPKCFQGSIPRDTWEKMHLQSHHPNLTAAHSNSLSVTMEMLYICTVQLRSHLSLVVTEYVKWWFV